MVTVGQAESLFYKSTGFLVLPSVFTEGECDEIVTILKQYTDNDFSRQTNLERKNSKIRSLIHDPRIYMNLEALYEFRRMGYVGSQVLYKQPGTPFAKHAWNPHQDNFYLKALDDCHCTATVIFGDSTPENGGMYFYPGSQTEPVLDHERNPSDDPTKNPGAKVLNIPSKYRRIDIWLKKGDLLIHHGNVIHGSTANLSARGRYHLNISCAVEGVPFNTEGKSNRKFSPFR